MPDWDWTVLPAAICGLVWLLRRFVDPPGWDRPTDSDEDAED
jgi:hypothetical protein